MTTNGACGPWRELATLVEANPQRIKFRGHPSIETLWDYLHGELPERPRYWDEQRVQALMLGTISDWTVWEVAIHCRLCRKCRRNLMLLEHAKVIVKRILQLKAKLNHPKLAWVGWTLAGVQTVVLIILFIWALSLPRGIKESPPVIEPGLSVITSSYPTSYVSLRVIFSREADFGQITQLLDSVGAKIVDGPDVNGAYKVLVPQSAVDLLKNSPLLLSLPGGDN